MNEMAVWRMGKVIPSLPGGEKKGYTSQKYQSKERKVVFTLQIKGFSKQSDVKHVKEFRRDMILFRSSTIMMNMTGTGRRIKPETSGQIKPSMILNLILDNVIHCWCHLH